MYTVTIVFPYIFNVYLSFQGLKLRIVSIFANKTGRICMRAHSEVVRSDTGVKPLELGDWIELQMDLDAP